MRCKGLSGRWFAAVSLVVVLAIGATVARAQDAPPVAVTVDPTVAVEDLEYLVRPLTAEDLEVEARAWRDLLKAKVTEVSAQQITARKASGAARAAALDQVSRLREERTAIVDRITVVLSEMRAKGGDPQAFTDYVDAVAGLVSDIDVTDASTAWESVQGWARSPEGGGRWGKNIGLFLLTLLITLIVARIVARIVRRAMNTRAVQLSDMLEAFIVNTARNTVWVIGFVIALSVIEVEIGPFLAAMGVVGFVIGFALQDTLGNFAAGLMILIYRPYDLGNFVDVGGVKGTVTAMSLVATTLKTPDNQTIVVPNGKIWGGTITNITGSATRRVDMMFGISYADDMDRAKALLEEIVTSHEKTHDDPAPVVKLHELADSSVNFIVRPWVDTGDYWDVFWDVTQEVKRRFDAEGISIPFPQREVTVIHKDTPSM